MSCSKMAFAAASCRGLQLSAAEVEFCTFLLEHCHGVLAACSDDPQVVINKFLANGVTISLEHATLIASLSNWFKHQRHFKFVYDEDRTFNFECTEQVVIGIKSLKCLEKPKSVIAHLEEIENAPVEWKKKAEANELEGLYKRCWQGLVKHYGRVLAMEERPEGMCDDDFLDLNKAVGRSFTEDNMNGLQFLMQYKKFFEIQEPNFVLALTAVAKWNSLHPESEIFVCEATKGDDMYSVNAGFFDHLLPEMQAMVKDGSVLSGESLAKVALERLVELYREDKAQGLEEPRGIKKIGADILGHALRQVVGRVQAQLTAFDASAAGEDAVVEDGAASMKEVAMNDFVVCLTDVA